MRVTLSEQIKAATAAYLVPLNHPKDGMATHRFACYLLSSAGLTVLWPESSDSMSAFKREADEAGLYAFVYSKRELYPAYHFALGGCGYSKGHKIATLLKRCNSMIEVFELTGGTPSHVAV